MKITKLLLEPFTSVASQRMQNQLKNSTDCN